MNILTSPLLHLKQMPHDKSGVEHTKDTRYFNVSSQSGNRTSDFASFFHFQKSGLHTAIDWLSKVSTYLVICSCTHPKTFLLNLTHGVGHLKIMKIKVLV